MYNNAQVQINLDFYYPWKATHAYKLILFEV
jgi:hypothetical protein